MLKRLRNWAAGSAGEENARLRELLKHASNVIAGQSHSIGAMYSRVQEAVQEKLIFMAAAALQNGGTMSVPVVLLDAVQQGNYRVVSEAEGDKIVVRLVDAGAEGGGTDADEDGGCGGPECGGGGCGQCP